MKELISVKKKGDNITVSGRALHEYLEVKTRYDHWFKRMLKYGFEKNVDYVAIGQKRPTAQGNESQYIDHEISIDMAKEIAMIQRNEKGKQAREYFVAVEKKLRSQYENEEDFLLDLAKDYIRVKEESEALKLKIVEDKDKVELAETISRTEECITFGQLGKILKQNGVNIGGVRLKQWLRANGYLMNTAGEYNKPTQKSMNKKLMRIVEEVCKDKPPFGIKIRTFVTGKGQKYFIKKFKNIGFTSGGDRFEEHE